MHGMKAYESSGGTIHAFLTSVPDGVEWQAACIRQYPLTRMLGGTQPPNERLAVEKHLLPQPGIDRRPLGHSVSNNSHYID
jgi:hypothetical protein